jgi:hypothetical protein
MVEKGSIIEFWGSPGPHLYPLTQPALDAFETWYAEEHPVLDKDSEPIFYIDENGARTQKMYKPHAAFRRQDYKPAEKERFTLVAAPPAASPAELNHTLAGLGLKEPTKDVRPPPDRIYRDAPVVAPPGEAAPPPETDLNRPLSPAEALLSVKSSKPVPKRELAELLRSESAQGAGLASAAKAVAKEAES